VPWTLASNYLIHTSCTTGLEAALAKKSALSIVPYETWYSKSIVSNKINSVFESAASAFSFIKPYIEQNKAFDPGTKKINEYYQTNNNNLSVDIIYEKLSSLIFNNDSKTELPDFKKLPERHPKTREKILISMESFEKKVGLLNSFYPDDLRIKELNLNEIGDSIFEISL
jgi:hypothetical protein